MSSLPSPSSFSVSCALSCFLPLTGLYWNKSLVTHAAVFLWVSQANFDTVIMPSLSVSFSSPSRRLSLSLRPDLPSFPSYCTQGRAIHHCKSCLSLSQGCLGLGPCWVGVELGPQTNLCPKMAKSEPEQRSAYPPRAC